MEKIKYFNHIRFTLDNQSGYYLSARKINGKQIRMHRYIWEFFNGIIPDGFCIHHIDHDKSNNNIDNLMLINEKEHMSHHSIERINDNREKFNIHLDNIRPLTKEWHKSVAGKEWHQQHYENMKNKLHQRVPKKCMCCGIDFNGLHHSKVCSNKCKSALRRKLGLDEITKICEICNNEFKCNSYRVARTCSRSCSGKLRQSEANKKDKSTTSL